MNACLPPWHYYHQHSASAYIVHSIIINFWALFTSHKLINCYDLWFSSSSSSSSALQPIQVYNLYRINCYTAHQSQWTIKINMYLNAFKTENFFFLSSSYTLSSTCISFEIIFCCCCSFCVHFVKMQLVFNQNEFICLVVITNIYIRVLNTIRLFSLHLFLFLLCYLLLLLWLVWLY